MLTRVHEVLNLSNRDLFRDKRPCSVSTITSGQRLTTKKNKMASASLEEEETELNFGKLLVRTFSASAPPDTKRDAQWKVERLNLLNIANLCIKNLIDSALKLGRVIGDEPFEPFQQFFVVLESILRHGLKSKWAFSQCSY